jgi:hypothetical protein
MSVFAQSPQSQKNLLGADFTGNPPSSVRPRSQQPSSNSFNSTLPSRRYSSSSEQCGFAHCIDPPCCSVAQREFAGTRGYSPSDEAWELPAQQDRDKHPDLNENRPDEASSTAKVAVTERMIRILGLGYGSYSANPYSRSTPNSGDLSPQSATVEQGHSGQDDLEFPVPGSENKKPGKRALVCFSVTS